MPKLLSKAKQNVSGKNKDSINDLFYDTDETDDIPLSANTEKDSHTSVRGKTCLWFEITFNRFLSLETVSGV